MITCNAKNCSYYGLRPNAAVEEFKEICLKARVEMTLDSDGFPCCYSFIRCEDSELKENPDGTKKG